jgi:hypothetical protein
LPEALTPVRRVRLARETPRLALPVARARGGVERPSESVTESISDGSPEPSARPSEAPPETVGGQTITRARGRSTAGVAGRLEQSFSRPDRKPMPLPSIPTPLARTGGGAAASKLLNPSRGRLDR